MNEDLAGCQRLKGYISYWLSVSMVVAVITLPEMPWRSMWEFWLWLGPAMGIGGVLTVLFAWIVENRRRERGE